MSGHLTLGSPWKSSRHPAGALPVFEGVPGDDPPSTEADGRNDALLQHRVDREPPDGEPVSDFGDRHSAAHIVTAMPFARNLFAQCGRNSPTLLFPACVLVGTVGTPL